MCAYTTVRARDEWAFIQRRDPRWRAWQTNENRMFPVGIPVSLYLRRSRFLKCHENYRRRMLFSRDLFFLRDQGVIYIIFLPRDVNFYLVDE